MTKPIVEQRFREGSGERYMRNGAIRCHGISRGKVKEWRKEHDDWDTPTEELWPECQCNRPALQGYYGCKWHGGKLPNKRDGNRSLLDAVPIDLREKVEILLEDPFYISRREDIAVLRARQWEILSQLEDKLGGEEAWGDVAEALFELRRGKDDSAQLLLEKALSEERDVQEIWKEYYQVERILKDITNTEVKTAKELKSMATADQVLRLVDVIYNIIDQGAKKFIVDDHTYSQFIQFISGRIAESSNFGSTTIVNQLESSRRGSD